MTTTQTINVKGTEVTCLGKRYAYTTKAGYARIACSYCIFNGGKLRVANHLDITGAGICQKCGRGGALNGATKIDYIKMTRLIKSEEECR